MNSPQPFVSVIIPHFNDQARLSRCLTLLEKQTYPSHRYEIIVVDNGSDSLPEATVNSSPHSRLLFEAKPGSYIARNRGISVAQGEVIAFTDSDCVPSLDWLDQGVDAITRNSNMGFIAGHINVFPRNTEAPTIAEQYEMVRAFPIKENVEKYHFGVTGNLFTLRNVIDRVGLFDETLKSSGDSDWCERVYAQGYNIVYAEGVCVNHPARMRVKDIYQRARRWGGGFHDRQARYQSPKRYFIQSFPHDILPPFKKSWYLWSLHQYSVLTRLQLIGIEWISNYGVAFERVGLAFGGQSKRS